MFQKIKDAISPMRDGTGAEKALYWIIRVMAIAVPILLVAAIGGFIYCKINGITIAFPGA